QHFAYNSLPGESGNKAISFPNAESTTPTAFEGFQIGNSLLVGLVYKTVDGASTAVIPPDNRWIPLRTTGLRGTPTATENVQAQIWMLPNVEKPVERLSFSFSASPAALAVGWLELRGLDPRSFAADMTHSASTV